MPASFWTRFASPIEVVILSDTFYEFARPLMRQLGQPTLFCHSLEVDDEGMLVNYRLRMPDQKRAAVQRLRELNFRVVAAGDSYNDTAMLGEAHRGIFFHPPASVVEAFPQFPVTRSYDELRGAIDAAFAELARLTSRQAAMSHSARAALSALRATTGAVDLRVPSKIR